MTASGWRFALALILGLTTLGLAACGSDGGSGKDQVQSPMEPYGDSTTWVFTGSVPTIADDSFLVGTLGEKSINGQTYSRRKVAYGVDDPLLLNDASTGAEFWTAIKGDTLVFGGFAETSVVEVTMDAPLEINLYPPVGVPQSVSATGKLLLNGETVPLAGGGTATYTLVSDNETVDTGAGPVPGVAHYTFSGNLDGDGVPIVLKAITVTGDFYYHPELGLVKYDIPLFNTGMTLEETQDLGSPDGPDNVIQKQAVIDSTNRQFLLESRMSTGKLDADRMQHAYFYMELRWADEARARTEEAPTFAPQGWAQTNPAFIVNGPGIMMGEGYFAYTLMKSPVSLLHPEENGKGFYYWAGFASEASKNSEGQKGVSYGIRVSYDDFCTGPMRVAAKLYYKRTKDIPEY
jgi:hypothetical protein